MTTPLAHRSIRSTADDFTPSSRFRERRSRKRHFGQFDRHPLDVQRDQACSLPALTVFTFTLRPVAALAQDAAVGNPALPRDLTPWGMFMSADNVVKTVLIGLAFASVVTWTVWLAKSVEIAFAKRRVRLALNVLTSAGSLPESIERPSPKGEVTKLLDAVRVEFRLYPDSVEPHSIKERIASRVERIQARYGRQILRGTGVLATIGATAPFVGLFGTVWGIMNSFIGISKSHTTNLAVVAPGIAEALLATALGLAAAIPAVVIYNIFARSTAGYRALLGDAAAEVLRLVSRDLGRQVATPASSAGTPTLTASTLTPSVSEMPDT
jgi:biopolymer transport protein ExbB